MYQGSYTRHQHYEAGPSERDIMSNEEERKRSQTMHLEWRDYVALVVASLETTLLPILVMVAMLVLFALVVIRR